MFCTRPYIPMAERQQHRRDYKCHVDNIGETLLRVLGGVSRKELNDPEKAARTIQRTVRIMSAYTIVASLALFFVSIPSFIDIGGSLHTKNFSAFFWIGSPFFDCVALLVACQYLGQTKNLPVTLCLAGLSGFEAYIYAHYTMMTDVVMLIMSLMVFFHTLQILVLLVFGRHSRPTE